MAKDVDEDQRQRFAKIMTRSGIVKSELVQELVDSFESGYVPILDGEREPTRREALFLAALLDARIGEIKGTEPVADEPERPDTSWITDEVLDQALAYEREVWGATRSHNMPPCLLWPYREPCCGKQNDSTPCPTPARFNKTS